MTKTELIQVVAEEVKLPKKTVATVIEQVVETITEKLIAGEKVVVPGFGVFFVSQMKTREGINPKTGERIKIPPTKMPRFSASKKLKDLVNSRIIKIS